MASEKKWTEAADAHRRGSQGAAHSAAGASQYVALQNAGKTAEANALADAWRRHHRRHDAHRSRAQQAMERKDYAGCDRAVPCGPRGES
jgi:hypothetical protein